ncbi:MAG: hypothetical protein Q4A27_01715 [bacterium]|nr:hypothetical protein [bacterium]
MTGTQIEICPKLWDEVEKEIEKISDDNHELSLQIKMTIFRELLNPNSEEILKACRKVERSDKRERLAEILLAMAGYDKTKMSARERISAHKAEAIMQIEDEKVFYFLIYSDWDVEIILHIKRVHMTYSDLIAVLNYCRATGRQHSEVVRSFARNKQFLRKEQKRIYKVQSGRAEIMKGIENMALIFPEELFEDFQSISFKKLSRPQIARIRRVVNSYSRGEIAIHEARKALNEKFSSMIPVLLKQLKA